MSQPRIVELLYSCIVEAPSFSDEFIDIAVQSPYATEIIKNRRVPQKNVTDLLKKLTPRECQKAEKEIAGLVDEKLLKHIIDLNTFFGSLESMIYAMQDSSLKKSLINDYLKETLIEDFTYTQGACKLVARILIVTLTKIKNKLDKKDEAIIPKKSSDPFHNVIDFNFSEALNINIFQKKSKGIVFYNFDSAVDYIIKNNYKIKNIDCKLNHVEVWVEEMPYNLKKLNSDDYDEAIEFIILHEEEFLRKRKWKASLSEMCRHGLGVIKKWTAYGIYNQEGKIVAYIDYKLRTDAYVELGVALIHPDLRNQGFVSSLIYLVQLKYAFCGFFGGTYEENISMRKAFVKASFKEHEIFNYDTGKITAYVKERINPEDPGNPGKDTNSVYYTCESLIRKM